MNIQIARIEIENISASKLEELAKLYCSIWKESPWNEDFWTVEGIINDFCKEMGKPCAEAYVAVMDSNNIVGFTWGYEVSRYEIHGIAGTNALDFLFEDNERVFYVDELGVDPDFRGKKIGTRLAESLLVNVVQIHKIKRFTLRTDVKAYAAKHLYAKLDFKELNIHDKKHAQRTYWLLNIL